MLKEQIEKILNLYKNGNSHIRLIIINAAIYITLKLAYITYFLTQTSGSNGGAIRANFNEIVFNTFGLSARISDILTKPWTILSYIFVHLDFFTLFFNMILLYVFGNLFFKYFTKKEFNNIFIGGGVIGAIVFLTFYSLFPNFAESKDLAFASGASAAIFAICSAIAAYIPNYEINFKFIGKLQLKYIIIAILVLDFIYIPNGRSGGHIAHIGGAIFGYLYIYFLKIKSNPNQSDNKSWDNPITSYLNKIRKDNKENSLRNERIKKAKKQKELLNKILKKVSKEGYSKLSESEKKMLFKRN